MPTIREIAVRIETAHDVDPGAALDAARTYYSQILDIDRGEQIAAVNIHPDTDATDATADLIVESHRRQLEAEGLL